MFDLNKRHKFWCPPCDFVCKARPDSKPLCPHCSQPGTDVYMIAMGLVWKPGPKGNRMKHYPEGYRLFTLVHGSQYPGGFAYVSQTIGGTPYRQATADKNYWTRSYWIPDGTKLRDQRGRIRSRRNVA